MSNKSIYICCGLVVLPIAGEIQKEQVATICQKTSSLNSKATGTRIKHNERNQDFPVKEVRIYNGSKRACTAGVFHIANQTTKHISSNTKCTLYKLILCFNAQSFTNQADYHLYSICFRNPFLENRAELSVSLPTCVPIKEAQLERNMTYLLVLRQSCVHSFVLKLDMHKDNVHVKSYNK
jgi:hypothetical protein